MGRAHPPSGDDCLSWRAPGPMRLACPRGAEEGREAAGSRLAYFSSRSHSSMARQSMARRTHHTAARESSGQNQLPMSSQGIDWRMSTSVKNGGRWRLQPFASTSAMTAEVSVARQQEMLTYLLGVTTSLTSFKILLNFSSRLLLHRVPCSSFPASTWRLTHRPNETHSITMGCYR